VATARDAETYAVKSRSFRSQLVAWFRADRRGLVPFVLLWSPSSRTYDESDEHLARMQTVATELARGLGVRLGPPQRGGEGSALDTEPYE
jgi:hypothetical protein